MPKKKNKISKEPSLVLIGRDKELQKIKENLANHKHTALVGNIGVGKSHLLKYAIKDSRKIIYVKHIQPLKTALISMAQSLHKDGRLKLEGTQAEYLEWQDLKRKVTRLPIMELLTCVVEKIKGYTVVLDHLESLTPSMAFTVSLIMDKALVLGATNDLKTAGHLARIWWRFDHIEVGNLEREEAQKLLWLYANEKKIEDKLMFENKVLTHSAGNPLAIVEMAKRTLDEKFDSVEKISELKHDAGIRYFDLTPVLLIIGAVVVAARFISLGLNDVDGYILAGSAGAFFMFLRYFLYRSMRKNQGR